MNKFFLYGKRKTGKSTIINNLINFLEVVPSGFRTLSDSADVEGNWDLYIVAANDRDIRFTSQNRIASCKEDGSWESYADIFNQTGVKLLTFEINPQIVVMDEIGFMEKDALNFQERIMGILEAPYPVIGVIKPVANQFMQKIYDHPDVKTIEVTGSNCEKIFKTLAAILQPQIY